MYKRLLLISILSIGTAQADSIHFVYKNNHDEATRAIVPTMRCGNFSYPFEGGRELDYRKKIYQAEYTAKPAGTIINVRELSWTCSIGGMSLHSAGGMPFYYPLSDMDIIFPKDFNFSKNESTVEFILENFTEDFSHCKLGYGGYRVVKYRYSIYIEGKKSYGGEHKDTFICDGPP